MKRKKKTVSKLRSANELTRFFFYKVLTKEEASLVF
jgi:hypothetical protein